MEPETGENTGTRTDETIGRSSRQANGGSSGAASRTSTGSQAGESAISGTGSLPTYISLLRPLNAVMAGVGVIVGGVVAVGMDITGQDVLLRVILAYLAAFFATGAGNALNDIVDAETDRVNHPERPIPSGKLTPAQVKRVVYLGYGVTFLLSAFVNYLIFIIAFINISLMVGYEIRLKKMGFVGNLTISSLTGSVFIFGGAATLEKEALTDMILSSEFRVTLILAFLAFLSSVGREIIKDIQDMEGDTDRSTLPMKVGKQRAGLLAAAMISIAVALSWLPYYFDILGGTYLAIVLPADVLFMYAALTGVSNPAQAQRLAKYAMLSALMAFMIGAIV